MREYFPISLTTWHGAFLSRIPMRLWCKSDENHLVSLKLWFTERFTIATKHEKRRSNCNHNFLNNFTETVINFAKFSFALCCGLDKKRPRLLWNVITQKKTISFGIDSEMKRNGRGWSWMVKCFKWLSSYKNQRIRKIWSTKHLLKSVELNLNRRFDRHLACQVVVLMLEAQKNCNYKLSWGEKTYTIPMNLISTKWK